MQYILQQDRKLTSASSMTDPVDKHSQEEDILRQVLAVMAAISSKIPLSVFSNVYFRNYARSLDPKHRPPHNLAINRIIEVLIDGMVLEFVRIVDEHRKLLRQGFISLSTDFATDPNRRQSFGVVLLDLVAEKYDLNDGRTLFMSRETAKKCKDLLSVSFIIF
jgi:hypothetical protein